MKEHPIQLGYSGQKTRWANLKPGLRILNYFFDSTGATAASETQTRVPVPLGKVSEGGWPTLVHSLFFRFPYQNVGAPALRFLQGWAAMLLIA